MAKKEIGRMSCPSCQAEHQVVFDDGFKCFSPCEVCGVETRFQKRKARDAIRERFKRTDPAPVSIKEEQPAIKTLTPEPPVKEPAQEPIESPAKAGTDPAESTGLFF